MEYQSELYSHNYHCCTLQWGVQWELELDAVIRGGTKKFNIVILTVRNNGQISGDREYGPVCLVVTAMTDDDHDNNTVMATMMSICVGMSDSFSTDADCAKMANNIRNDQI